MRPLLSVISPGLDTTAGLKQNTPSRGRGRWRSRADRIRTVEFVAQVIAKQAGRNHQWHIQVGPLMLAGPKQTFVIQNDE